MIDILRRLRRIALRRAYQEFERYSETWNQPYPILGSGVAFGLLGAVLCQIITMVPIVILIWELRNEPMFWPIVFIAGFSYGAIPGFALGAISGLAQAFVWSRRSRFAGLICLLGGTLVMARMAFLCADNLRGDPNWVLDLCWLLFLFCASFVWSALLLVYGFRLLRTKP